MMHSHMDDQDFIYERKKLPCGVKLEEITGGNRYKGRVWREIARQIYCENGRDGFREVGHFQSGAPFLYGEDERISISHTDGCLVVATIKTPDGVPLAEFSPETALGVDVESCMREKVAGLRERFLSDPELPLVNADSHEDCIIAWTCKEAMLKAGMDPSIDWKHDIIILSLPAIGKEGEGLIRLKEVEYPLKLYTYRSGGFIITVAR